MNCNNNKCEINTLSIEIIQRCMNNCLICSSLSNNKGTNIITTEKVLEIIDEMIELGINQLILSGGEPFLHEGIYDIIEHAISNRLKIRIYTSGIIESGEIDFSEYSDLKDNLTIIFDIPSIISKDYNAFTSNNNLDTVKLSLVNCIKNGIRTEMNVVPTSINIDILGTIVNYAKRIGVKRVNFLRLVNHGRTLDNQELILKDTDELKNKLKKLKSIHKELVRIGVPLRITTCKCNAGITKLHIMHNGNVIGCEAFKFITLKDDQGNKVEPDSIYSMSLKDIIEYSEYLELAEQYIVNKLELYNKCKENCPVQIGKEN